MAPKKERSCSLADLALGQSAVITGIQLPDEIRLKMVEMGIGTGRSVRFIRKAPLGDPLEIEIMNYRLAIRKSEARGIRVKLTAAPRASR